MIDRSRLVRIEKLVGFVVLVLTVARFAVLVLVLIVVIGQFGLEVGQCVDPAQDRCRCAC